MGEGEHALAEQVDVFYELGVLLHFQVNVLDVYAVLQVVEVVMVVYQPLLLLAIPLLYAVDQLGSIGVLLFITIVHRKGYVY
jgi:hypothetical protein